MAIQKELITADDLLRPPCAYMRCELGDEEVIEMATNGACYGVGSLAIGGALHKYVRTHELGRTCDAETGFRIRRNLVTLRAPDSTFLAAGRLTPPRPTQRFLQIAPDLVVEMGSLSDSAAAVQRKVEDWLGVGVRPV